MKSFQLLLSAWFYVLLSACGGGGGSKSVPTTVADTSAPILSASVPVNNATNVEPTAAIVLTFNEVVQLDQAGYLLENGVQPIASQLQINANTITITPNNAAHLTGAMRLQLTGVRDVAGNRVPAFNLNWTLRDSTPPIDTTPPSIVTRVPAANASNIDPLASIVVTFSEAIRSDAIDAQLSVNGTPITVLPNVTSNELLLQIQAAVNLTGTATLSLHNIRDLTGNVMADTSWSWTLRAPATVFGLDTRPSNTTCLAPAPVTTGGAATIAWQAAFPNLSNLSLPTAMFQLPGDNTHWYALLQAGNIVRFDNANNASTLTNVLDITDRVSFGGWQGDETGLLGYAVHPQFASNRYVFLYYSAPKSGGGLETRVARYVINNDGTFSKASELILIRISRPNANHLGGQLAFGPDGYLYIGSGDGGGSGDPDQNGQNKNTLLGKILRIDVDHTTGSLNYAIPSSNPYASSGGAKEVFAYGLRNPWRFSFDAQTGDFWVGDVGERSWEEINLITSGGNYGWSDMEGNGCYRSGCSSTGKTLPIRAIDHNNGSCSVIGGFVYRGAQYPSANGTYVYSDYCEHTMRSLKRLSDGTYSDGTHGSVATMIASFAQDNGGELFAIGHGSGTGTQIYKMVVTGGTTVPGTMASNLSQTGCVNASNPSQAVSGMIPFAVNNALWSDGASKQRYLSLPNNTQITLTNTGDFTFPVGSVLMKTFSLNNRLIETRLFARGELGWQGFSYEWRDDQSDAVLLNDGKDKTIDGQVWHYPSRGQCLNCHTAAAGFSLGAETKQMNSSLTYPSTSRTANQLDTLEHIQLFNSALTSAQKSEKLFALNENSASAEQKARSYLHSNCSGCHRPGGPTPVNLDLQFTNALSQTRVCDVTPTAGDLGISNARIVAPGAPERSVLLARMQATDGNRMPPLGTAVVDTQATAVISSWIASLTACTP